MNETDLRKYAMLMQEFGLTGLEVADGSQKVRLERNAFVAESAAPSALPVPSAMPERKAVDEIIVKSPIVGIFYAAPAENADPYVAVGDSVKKGQTLCIIEAMKLMNEIAAEEDGVISEICAANGQVVEFGTELFRIKR